jgi:putative NADPH-quinone reductase
LTDRYRDGALKAGHLVSIVDVATLEFDVLRSRSDWECGSASPAISRAQSDIQRSDHVVFIFPLWLGTLPALLKAFLEQVMRPGFAFDQQKGPFGPKLTGRSTRIIVTMGMPAWVYRLWFRSHGIKSFKLGILSFVGLRPNRVSYIGSVDTMSQRRRVAWLGYVEALGRKAQ